MDTSKYKKKCPRCRTVIEPKRYATTGTKILAGFLGAGGAVLGFCFGGPVGAAAGGALGYYANKKAIMAVEDDCDQNQWFKFKCPKCGCNWKEKIHTNDHPDDNSWIANAPY